METTQTAAKNLKVGDRFKHHPGSAVDLEVVSVSPTRKAKGKGGRFAHLVRVLTKGCHGLESWEFWTTDTVHVVALNRAP